MSEKIFGKARLRLMQGDITTQRTGAIVNAANAGLRGGGGVDGAIHRAGGPAIMEACRAIGQCPTGQAVLTTGGNLPAGHVIHAVAPIWRGGGQGEAGLLASAYRRSLEVADRNGIHRVSFPSLGTGAYGYPVDQAARVALRTVATYLAAGESGIEEVCFVLFDRDTLGTFERALDEL